MLSENEKQILLTMHDHLKKHSLWVYFEEGSHSSIHSDYAYDMAFNGDNHYVKTYEKRAHLSAIQLQLAMHLGLVTDSISTSISNVRDIPDSIKPYFGFKAGDEEQHHAFTSNEPGRFESSLTRMINARPENLETSFNEHAKSLFEPEEVQIAQDLWNGLFPKAEKPKTKTGDPATGDLKTLFEGLEGLEAGDIYYGVCRDGNKGLVALFGEDAPYGAHGDYTSGNENKHERARIITLDWLDKYIKHHSDNTKHGNAYRRAFSALKQAELDVAEGKKSIMDFPDFHEQDIEAREQALGILSSAKIEDTFTAQHGQPQSPRAVIFHDSANWTGCNFDGFKPPETKIAKMIWNGGQKVLGLF